MFNCTGQNVMAMSYALSTYLFQNYDLDELEYISNVLLLLGQQIQTAISEEEFCKIIRERRKNGNNQNDFIEEVVL